jgi:hypothetical protein
MQMFAICQHRINRVDIGRRWRQYMIYKLDLQLENLKENQFRQRTRRNSVHFEIASITVSSFFIIDRPKRNVHSV